MVFDRLQKCSAVTAGWFSRDSLQARSSHLLSPMANSWGPRHCDNGNDLIGTLGRDQLTTAVIIFT